MTFKSWYARKIALKPVGTIIRTTRWVVLFQFLLLLALYATGLYVASGEYSSVSLVLFALEICLACYFLKFILSPYGDTLNNILLEQIDLEKYLALARDLSQRGWNSKARSQLKEVLLQQEAQVDYLTGNFEACLEKLDRLQLDLIPSKHRSSFRNGATYLRLMCLLQQNQWEEAEALLEKIETNKEQVEAIIAVSKGEVTTYFDTWEPQWRLEKISKAYNQGKNLLNQGKTSEAKEYFASIINENPKLFIEARAKQYVKELDSNG